MNIKIISVSLFFITGILSTTTFASHLDVKHARERTVTQETQNPLAAQAAVTRIRRPFDLMHPIPSFAVHSADANAEKKDLFNRACTAKDTLQLYHLAHDPVIKKYIANHDIKHMLYENHINDAQGRNAFTHAIENNDAPFASYCTQGFSFQGRKQSFLYAGRSNRPRVMLALVDKKKYESEQESVYRALSECSEIPFENLPVQALHAMFNLMDQHKVDRSNSLKKLYGTVLSRITPQKAPQQQNDKAPYEFCFGIVPHHEFTKLYEIPASQRPKTISPQLHHIITDMLMPSRVMPSEFEEAIKKGNQARVDELLQQGCLAKDRTMQGKDALTLAVECAHPEVLKKLIQQSSYISRTKRRILIAIANKRKEEALLDENLTNDQARAQQQKFNAIITILNENLLAHRLSKKLQLRKSMDQRNIGRFLQALRTGANPNATHSNGQPYSYSLVSSHNPLFLNLLLKFGANANAIVPCLNGWQTILAATVRCLDDLACAQELLNAGANPYQCNNYGVPAVVDSLDNENSHYLTMMLQPRTTLAKKLDPNAMIADSQDNEWSLLYWAMHKKKMPHFQQLLNVGADPNARISNNGNSIAYVAAINNDPRYLAMMLYPNNASAKKLDPNTMLIDDKGVKWPLLAWAMDRKKMPHFQQLLNAGADPNARSSAGDSIAYYATVDDDPRYLAMMLYPNNASAKKLDPNTMKVDDKGVKWPILFWAMYKKKMPHFQRLLNAGADPNARSSADNPIAYAATVNDDPRYLAMMLDPKNATAKTLNPDTMVADNKGVKWPILFWAMQKRKRDNFLRLLEAGADLNFRNSDGVSTAFRAWQHDDAFYLKTLLARGLNPQQVAGKTPCMMCGLFVCCHPNLTISKWLCCFANSEKKQALLDAGASNCRIL